MAGFRFFLPLDSPLGSRLWTGDKMLLDAAHIPCLDGQQQPISTLLKSRAGFLNHQSRHAVVELHGGGVLVRA